MNATLQHGMTLVRGAMIVNVLLAMIKIAAGILGRSYALIADGIESTTDVLSSLIVWSGLRVSAKPPDPEHPYGHGKAESLAAVLAALFLLGSAGLLIVQCIREIRNPHEGPAPFTLLVLLVAMVIKEYLYRRLRAAGDSLDSTALRNDAWHHRSDALTSLAAFVGITIALLGGPGYETADDWAALAACAIIIYNGFRLLKPALNEVMDGAAPPATEDQVRRVAGAVPGVRDVEKCRIRKSGLGLLMDLHVTVDGAISVHAGHAIAHQVKDALMDSPLPVHDVIVHIEPHDLPPAP